MEHSINSISKSSSDFSHSPVQLGINRQGSLQGRQVVHNTNKTAEQIKNHINSEGLQKSSGSGKSLKHRIKNSRTIKYLSGKITEIASRSPFSKTDKTNSAKSSGHKASVGGSLDQFAVASDAHNDHKALQKNLDRINKGPSSNPEKQTKKTDALLKDIEKAIHTHSEKRDIYFDRNSPPNRDLEDMEKSIAELHNLKDQILIKKSRQSNSELAMESRQLLQQEPSSFDLEAALNLKERAEAAHAQCLQSAKTSANPENKQILLTLADQASELKRNLAGTMTLAKVYQERASVLTEIANINFDKISPESFATKKDAIQTKLKSLSDDLNSKLNHPEYSQYKTQIKQQSEELKQLESELIEKLKIRPYFKSRQITDEFVSTELTYVNKLKTLTRPGETNTFLNELAKAVNEADKPLIKSYESNLQTLIKDSEQIHQQFQAAQRKLNEGDAEGAIKELENTYNNFGQYAESTTKCAIQQTQISNIFNQLKKEKPEDHQRLTRTLQSNPEVGGLLFSSILIMPVQRLPRHELLLRELTKSAGELPVKEVGDRLIPLSDMAKQHTSDMNSRLS